MNWTNLLRCRHRCLAVAVEVNSFADPSAPPAYFLGVFHGDRHENLGVSAEWGELEKFTARDLEIACQELQVENVVPL